MCWDQGLSILGSFVSRGKNCSGQLPVLTAELFIAIANVCQISCEFIDYPVKILYMFYRKIDFTLAPMLSIPGNYKDH